MKKITLVLILMQTIIFFGYSEVFKNGDNTTYWYLASKKRLASEIKPENKMLFGYRKNAKDSKNNEIKIVLKDNERTTRLELQSKEGKKIQKRLCDILAESIIVNSINQEKDEEEDEEYIETWEVKITYVSPKNNFKAVTDPKARLDFLVSSEKDEGIMQASIYMRISTKLGIPKKVYLPQASIIKLLRDTQKFYTRQSDDFSHC